MKDNERFLLAYRKYEQILKAKSLDVSAIEKSLETPEITCAKLRICRQMRNFMSHNDDPDFLVASPKQIEFLEDLIQEEKSKEDVVKNNMLSLKKGTVSSKDKCVDVLNKMFRLKLNTILVWDSENESCAVVSIRDIMKKVLEKKTSKMSDLKLPLKEYARNTNVKTCFELDNMSKANEYLRKCLAVIVTKEMSGDAVCRPKVVGILYR